MKQTVWARRKDGAEEEEGQQMHQRKNSLFQARSESIEWLKGPADDGPWKSS